jgi:hypothetical protein
MACYDGGQQLGSQHSWPLGMPATQPEPGVGMRFSQELWGNQAQQSQHMMLYAAGGGSQQSAYAADICGSQACGGLHACFSSYSG